MNIKIVDSWLREFLETKENAETIAKDLSLVSVSVEKTERINDDIVYEIEVTTNRPDLMSVKNIAKEAALALNENGKKAEFKKPKTTNIPTSSEKFPIKIKADPKLINRICAVVMEVEIGDSPLEISKRLELSGIRSLNNLIDVTNYVMRETGHPTHVFDFDLLSSKEMIIRESKKGETITTLDGKTYTLNGGDIVADDGSGTIIDLLGIMGTQNSVVNNNTKRIMFFMDNNNPVNIRKTSMNLGIRTEAAIINEKGLDPELMTKALERGIELYKQIANGKVISEIFDYYPNKPIKNKVTVSLAKINSLIGAQLSLEKCASILTDLGFDVKKLKDSLEVESPTERPDIKIEEDVIEEIARIYGYHKIESIVPTFLSSKKLDFANDFYFEQRIKNAFKYLGFTEVYTYSFVSEDLFEGPIEDAVKIKNPLTTDMEYLRNTLIPSLLMVEKENNSKETLKIFEVANIYLRQKNDLPKEVLTLSGIVKERNLNFFKLKGLIEAICEDLGINNLIFKKSQKGGTGASIYLDKNYLGEIEVLDENLIDFELNLEIILQSANLKKIFVPFAKFPPITQDISVITTSETQEIINEVKNINKLIVDVTLLDSFEDSRTFHIVFQDFEKNLTKEEVGEIRTKILDMLKSKFNAQIKE